MSKVTPLHEVHLGLGAVMTDFAGWSMPLRYGSETAEHRAVRTTAGLFDLSHMGEIEVTGPDAGRALDRALVTTPSAMAVGRARYSVICAEDGGIIDDLVIYRLAEQKFMVVANASNAALVASELTDRAQSFDTMVRDASENWALLAVQGPKSADILTAVTELDLTALRYYAIDPSTLTGKDVLIARTGYTGEDGFEVYCATKDAVDVWASLSGAGAGHGLAPTGLACRDTLRLEAGMALYGQELTRNVTPFEAGLGRVIALDKVDGFVGREALEARHREGPQSVLVGLKPTGRRTPRTGYAVHDPANGQQVGTVTSGAPSPTLGHPIAMAYVTPQLSTVGTQVHVDIRGAMEPAHVVDLPFYKRPR